MRLKTKKRFGIYSLSLILFLIFIVCAKILFFSYTYHHPSWDESVFIGMGKWINSGQKTGLWEKIRPPGLPLLLSSIPFKGDFVQKGDFIMLLLTLGIIILTYLSTKEFYTNKIALIASIITFINPIFFNNSNRILSSIPALFFCMLSLYLILKKKYIASGVACFFAFFFRYPAGLIYPAIFIIMILRDKFENKEIFNKSNIKRYFKFNVTFIVLLCLFLIYNKLIYGSFLEPLILASKHQSTFTGNVQGIAYLFFYPVVLFSTSIILLFAFISKDKKNIIYYYLTPLIIFFTYFTIIPHKEIRFLVIMIPFISILAAIGIAKVLSFRKDKYYKMTILFILFLLIVPSCINCFMTHKNFPKEKPNGIDEYINILNDKMNGTILTSDPIVAAYTNHKFIHFYDDTKKGLNIIKNNINNSQGIIYYKSAFPWNNKEAEKEKKEMLEIIKNKSSNMCSVQLQGGKREIYILR
ncbi:MAG: hypothetical protein ACQESF_03240 [Nanobdellota archaeon]